MFDIGFWELVVIAVVALVVLGPERLPVAIRTASHWIRLIRSTANSVKSELEQELRLQELHNDLKRAEQLQMSNLSPELQASIEQLKAAAQSVTRPYEKQNTIAPAPAAAEVKGEEDEAPAQPAVTGAYHAEPAMVPADKSAEKSADKSADQGEPKP